MGNNTLTYLVLQCAALSIMVEKKKKKVDVIFLYASCVYSRHRFSGHANCLMLQRQRRLTTIVINSRLSREGANSQ